MQFNIDNVSFIKSSPDEKSCPKHELPEYAFVGRSNVGKSSLINFLMGRKKLAKISAEPGKTRLINHFLVGETWYLVDLPGYGYAKVSKGDRKTFMKLIYSYLQKRSNLTCLFLLIDSRHDPQTNDLKFIQWLGINGIPFAIIFTKTDKLTPSKLEQGLDSYKNILLLSWESLPPIFTSSTLNKTGREEILSYITETNARLQKETK